MRGVDTIQKELKFLVEYLKVTVCLLVQLTVYQPLRKLVLLLRQLQEVSQFNAAWVCSVKFGGHVIRFKFIKDKLNNAKFREVS